ncbi:ROK family protein [Neobacillus niacini]|uniref:ROK family protein n=1 Tax=Neobacillus niacini TaxID=86668 RepID=UPI0021CB2BB2|nr:ROK family protein [Neobacillus niacini]MCM3763839.1 ROK family protein [Neobacillus niacini]
MYFGAIEAGGTKFVCAVSNEQLEIISRVSIPTTSPAATLEGVFEFFDSYELSSIGIGSFGPIDINKQSKTYGYITSTPKPGWDYFNFVGAIKSRYHVPVAFTTDVNAAAYGEFKQGSAVGSSSCLYLTIGTGIGGGAVVNGEILEGFSHPEMGHLLVRKHPEDQYEGHCPYHKDCFEGLAAGPALEGRYGINGRELASNEKVWEMEASYIAQALVNYTLILRPEKIILGGGVMKQTQLFPLIRAAFAALLNNYVETPELNDYIVSPGFGDNAGIMGSLLLARETHGSVID